MTGWLSLSPFVLPAQVTSVVLFNIGPVTPFTEYSLFDSVRKPRHISIVMSMLQYLLVFREFRVLGSFQTPFLPYGKSNGYPYGYPYGYPKAAS